MPQEERLPLLTRSRRFPLLNLHHPSGYCLPSPLPPPPPPPPEHQPHRFAQRRPSECCLPNPHSRPRHSHWHPAPNLHRRPTQRARSRRFQRLCRHYQKHRGLRYFPATLQRLHRHRPRSKLTWRLNLLLVLQSSSEGHERRRDSLLRRWRPPSSSIARNS